jgi:integrase
MRIHERLLLKRLKPSFAIQSLTVTDLQSYIHERSKDKGHRGTVTAATIKKGIVTLRTVWNWGVQHGHLTGKFPNKGLKYPKGKEKRPFMQYTEIERLVVGMDEKEQAELWECLFLTLPEIAELLKHVKEAARQPFIYPMFVFAAHTGARRAEILRSKVRDIDFAGNFITIHERKKSHDRLTTRRVPMSPLLKSVMHEWLATHPGGEFTFCQGAVVRSKSRRTVIQPVRRDEAHDHFKRTLAGSKWDKLRGWHVFRHSFCSNCASRWIDQRLINEWVGHLSESMVIRYRHLIADQQQEAINLVFAS